MTAGASKLAAERGYVYSLLSTVFRQPLENGRLESLRAPGMLAAMKAAGVDPGADFINGDSAGLLEKLAVEYTQLFHGPGQHITPFEGMIADGDDELMGKAYVAVRVFRPISGSACRRKTANWPITSASNWPSLPSCVPEKQRRSAMAIRRPLTLRPACRKNFLPPIPGAGQRRLLSR